MWALVLFPPTPVLAQIAGPITAHLPTDTARWTSQLMPWINSTKEFRFFILFETIPCFTLQGGLLCSNKVAFNEIWAHQRKSKPSNQITNWFFLVTYRYTMYCPKFYRERKRKHPFWSQGAQAGGKGKRRNVPEVPPAIKVLKSWCVSFKKPSLSLPSYFRKY